MCLPQTPASPPAAPPPIPIERLVAKKADDIRPARPRANRKARKDKFNISTTPPSFGGVSTNSVTKALSLKK